MELPSFYKTFAKNILRLAYLIWRSRQKGQKVLMMCALAQAATHVSSATAAEIYNLVQLQQAISQFLAKEYQRIPHQRIDIQMGNVDKRLQLKPCGTPLEFIPQDPSGLGGNISVKVQCSGPTTWAIHIPAQVNIYREMPVAAQDIKRGHLIQPTNLVNALVNISSIRQAFAAEPEAIVGHEARRNIGKGEIFTHARLASPTSVKRGELVALQSVIGEVTVSSSGIAMSDGRLGQKIRVKNASSDRVVTGVVQGPGIVQTL